MNKIFLFIIIMSLMIIQCSKKTDTQTTADDVNINEDIQSNETIPAAKILSKEDAAFLEKVKNKIVIDGDFEYTFKENGDLELLDSLYSFESSKDGTNAYYYETYNIQDRYKKGPSSIATNYRGYSVINGFLYEDNYQGYEGDPNETIMTKWERENYYSNYYYGEVKENPNFDNFPYENKADVTFNEYNRISRGILISKSDYKPEEVGDIDEYNFDGIYSNNNSFIELKKDDDGTFYFYAVNITTNEKGQTITNIQSTDISKMILEENQYAEPYCEIFGDSMQYGEVSGADFTYMIDITPISSDALVLVEKNGSYGFSGIYKRVPEIVEANDKSTKEKVYYNACKWYGENISELNDIFNKTVDFDFEGGGYYEINMENVYLYISKFKNSGYFSDSYIKYLENNFIAMRRDLENKEIDQVLGAMEFDWLFLSGEDIFNYSLDFITNEMKLKDIITYSNDDRKEFACISNRDMGRFSCLQVKKYNNEWLIEGYGR